MQKFRLPRTLCLSLTFSTLLLALPALAADTPALPAASPLQPLQPVPAAAAPVSTPVAPVPAAPAGAAPVAAAPAGADTGVVPEAKISPIPAALAGVWTGTLSRLNANNIVESEMYRVEVDVREPQVTVNRVATQSVTPGKNAPNSLSPATVSRRQSIPGAPAEFFAPELPFAKWDGHVLQQNFNENFTKGSDHVTVSKHLFISLEPDGKHARFNFKASELRIRRGARTERTEKNGNVLLTRER